GRLDKPYRGELAWGGSRADYYRVNTETAERTLIAKGVTRTMGSSPDGNWFLYLKDKRVYAFNAEKGSNTLLSAGDVSFLDTDDDYPYEKPTFGVAGWS